jgi:hypothetical protein
MTKGQVILLQICKSHVKNNETKEALEVIDAILEGEKIAQEIVVIDSLLSKLPKLKDLAADYENTHHNRT